MNYCIYLTGHNFLLFKPYVYHVMSFPNHTHPHACVQDLLTRVEEAVDQYLYWDEELTIIESVSSVSSLPPSSTSSYLHPSACTYPLAVCAYQ